MPVDGLEYTKILSRPEARHRYWHIHKADRDFFPDSGEIFEIKFHDRIFELKLNHKDDIMTGQLYEKYQFLEGHKVHVTRDPKGKYILDAPDTKPYPEIS